MYSYEAMNGQATESNTESLGFADLHRESVANPEMVQFMRSIDATGSAISKMHAHIERIYAQAAQAHPLGLVGFLSDHYSV